MKRIALLALIGLLTAGPALAGGPGRGNGPGRAPNGGDCRFSEEDITPLTAAEAADLVYLREEEKLARDVYTNLYARWRVTAFRNIAASEQRHMDAVGRLLERYGVEDPVGANAPGVFKNASLKALYDTLTEKGRRSLPDALLVGAGIEDLDIADLKVDMTHTEKEDLLQVYGNLLRGSRNHLRAFARLLEREDLTYDPVHISAEEYAEIVGSPRERGRGYGNGNGRGRGHRGGYGRGGWR